ncbi:MAG: adenylate/guanylate cyclase domain-containing protein [Candidatus Rokuibacteriota bacterium]
MAASRAEVPLLVVFVDLTRFAAQSQRVSDRDLADTLDAFYEHVARAVDGAGGVLIKLMGDAALIVFEVERVERGVTMLLDLKRSVDALMAARDWECRLVAKAHFGPVIAGPFGGAGAKRYDVVGKTVNTAAMLEATGITLSVAAFRKLGRELRTRFKKHTPPITYIRTEDPHRLRSRIRP